MSRVYAKDDQVVIVGDRLPLDQILRGMTGIQHTVHVLNSTSVCLEDRSEENVQEVLQEIQKRVDEFDKEREIAERNLGEEGVHIRRQAEFFLDAFKQQPERMVVKENVPGYVLIIDDWKVVEDIVAWAVMFAPYNMELWRFQTKGRLVDGKMQVRYRFVYRPIQEA